MTDLASKRIPHQHRKLPYILAIIALGATGTTAGVLATTGAAASNNGPTSSPPPVASPAPITTAQAAIQAAEQSSTVFTSVTRASAKEMTFADITAAANAPGTTVSSPEPSTANVWVVAISGAVHPEFDTTNQTFTWGVEVFDAQSGRGVAEFAGVLGSWPTYFDGLPDISASSTS